MIIFTTSSVVAHQTARSTIMQNDLERAAVAAVMRTPPRHDVCISARGARRLALCGRQGFCNSREAQGTGPLYDGAKGANRTRDTALFRRVLYRLSYLGSTLFLRAHRVVVEPRQRGALVTMATLMGLEPTTFAVTGRRSNQLSYSAKGRPRRHLVGTAGLEPATPRV